VSAETPEMIAAIAAGLFAALDPASPVSGNGNTGGTASAVTAAVRSNWTQKGRSEALR
jgi:hypothetical protein